MNPYIPAGSVANAPSSFWKQPFTWLGIFIYVGFCLYVFWDFFVTGGPTVSSLGGDPVKNLYTYLYGATYGGGSLHFKGMNYPFGEHLSFADAQPLLTVPLGWLQKGLLLSQSQLIYIMYSAIAISFVVGMAYTQRLLQYFGVQPLLAILLSALILIMSPHTFRYIGHYPLAYASLLPMLFYWSVCYYETNHSAFLVKIFLLFTAYAFLHLYFLAMVLLWSGAYAFGAALLRRGKIGAPLWHSLRYLIPLAATFGLTKIFFALTDSITDRPNMPYAGGYEPGGGLQMLTSAFSPVWVAIQDAKIVEHIHETSGEFCYLGLAPLLMLLILGIISATGFWKKISAGQRPFEGQWLLIAGLTLLFSVTIKYYWELGIFNELFRPLRQFRTPERFSWIGYYILSISGSIVLYRLCHYWWLQRKRVLASLFGFFIIALWAIDANGAILFFGRANTTVAYNGDYLLSKRDSWKAYLAGKGYPSQNFSAILGLPLVHVGSEKIWLNDYDSYVITPCFKASLEMQLPIVDVYMSRTSWSQTFETVQLVGGPFTNGAWLSKVPQERPLLLAYYEEYPLNSDERALFHPGIADSIGKIDGCQLYAFWPQKWLRWQATEVHNARLLATAQPAGTDVQVPASGPFYVNHFENSGTGKPFAGRHGAMPINGEDSLFATLLFPKSVEIPTLYEFSAWTQLPADDYRSNYYQIKCYDSLDKELLITDALAKSSTDNAPDMWFRSSKYFKVPTATRRIAMHIRNSSNGTYLALDEVLLRPADAKVISKLANGTILVNNHLLRP